MAGGVLDVAGMGYHRHAHAVCAGRPSSSSTKSTPSPLHAPTRIQSPVRACSAACKPPHTAHACPRSAGLRQGLAARACRACCSPSALTLENAGWGVGRGVGGRGGTRRLAPGAWQGGASRRSCSSRWTALEIRYSRSRPWCPRCLRTSCAPPVPAFSPVCLSNPRPPSPICGVDAQQAMRNTFASPPPWALPPASVIGRCALGAMPHLKVGDALTRGGGGRRCLVVGAGWCSSTACWSCAPPTCRGPSTARSSDDARSGDSLRGPHSPLRLPSAPASACASRACAATCWPTPDALAPCLVPATSLRLPAMPHAALLT